MRKLLLLSLILLATLVSAQTVVTGDTPRTVAKIVATKTLTGQTAAIGYATIYTPTTTGTYRISYAISMEAAGTAGTINPLIRWDSGTGAAAITLSTWAAQANTNLSRGWASVVLKLAAGANLDYGTSFSSVTGSPQYGLNIIVEQLN